MPQHRSTTMSDQLARAALVIAALAVVAVAGYAVWAGTTAMTADEGSATGMAEPAVDPDGSGEAPLDEADGADSTADDSTTDEDDIAEEGAADGADEAVDGPGECVFADLGGELPAGYEKVQPCPSGATLHITAPDGYGDDPRDGGPANDRNKASASSGDEGIRVEIRNPISADPFVVIPAEQPGCFAQYIIEAGFEWIPMIDAAEQVVFTDDGAPKTFVANEDCANDDVTGEGTGDELTISYQPAP